jgi:hypothetical protein
VGGRVAVLVDLDAALTDLKPVSESSGLPFLKPENMRKRLGLVHGKSPDLQVRVNAILTRDVKLVKGVFNMRRCVPLP